MKDYDTMNIYAPKGTKVYFMDCNGYDSELVHCREQLGLKKGQCLTVSHTIVGNWSTEVYFEEFGDTQYFNSVMFTEEIMDKRTIQFKHERHFDSKGNLKAKGGRTIALEVPTFEEFKAFNPNLKEPIMLKMGIAECSTKDHYNKKMGRNISTGRMDDCFFVVTLKSESEVQLYHLASQTTVILRKHKNTDRVYFEEVV